MAQLSAREVISYSGAEEIFGISWRDAEGYRRPHGQGDRLEAAE